jgi:AbrB family looped-hinge helix DNA binding protein
MLATLTSKGQITLPKEIRDALELDAGAKLDFSIQPDGTLTVRPLKRSVSAIVGLLRQPAGKAATVEEMNRAVESHLAGKHDRIRRESSSAQVKRNKGRP